MFVDDAGSIEVPLLLLLYVLCRAREVEVGHLLSIVGYVCRWASVELVHTDHLVVIEQENEKLVDNASIRELRVARVCVINVRQVRHAIGVKLALIAVVLRWTEANRRTMVSRDGDATIAGVEHKGQIQWKRRLHSCSRWSGDLVSSISSVVSGTMN